MEKKGFIFKNLNIECLCLVYPNYVNIHCIVYFTGIIWDINLEQALHRKSRSQQKMYCHNHTVKHVTA